MAAGEEEAYRGLLCCLLSTGCPAICLVVTAGDEDATREALQGMLTRVVRHIRAFGDESTFWSWLTVLGSQRALARTGKAASGGAIWPFSIASTRIHTDTEGSGRDPGDGSKRLGDALERNSRRPATGRSATAPVEILRTSDGQ